jgi:transposase
LVDTSTSTEEVFMQRRPFARKKHTPEFKVEAVRVMRERLARSVTLQRVSEELDVHPDVLREWAKRVAGAPPDAAPQEIFPGHGQRRRFAPATTMPRPDASGSLKEEVRRLRRENDRLRQERDFLKKAGSVLREGVAVKHACIAAHRDSFDVTHVCRAWRLHVRLLRGGSRPPAAVGSAGARESAVTRRHSCRARGESSPLWSADDSSRALRARCALWAASCRAG